MSESNIVNETCIWLLFENLNTCQRLSTASDEYWFFALLIGFRCTFQIGKCGSARSARSTTKPMLETTHAAGSWTVPCREHRWAKQQKFPYRSTDTHDLWWVWFWRGQIPFSAIYHSVDPRHKIWAWNCSTPNPQILVISISELTSNHIFGRSTFIPSSDLLCSNHPVRAPSSISNHWPWFRPKPSPF